MTYPLTFFAGLAATSLYAYYRYTPKVELTKLDRNLLYAKEAVDYTTKCLPYGAVNYDNDLSKVSRLKLVKMNLMINDAEAASKNIPLSHNFDLYYEVIAKVAKEHKIGNCGEHSAIAYTYLKNEKNLRKLDYLALVNGDHAFVVIGRKPGSDVTDPTTWGDAAVVCEPWGKTYYPAIQVFDQLNKISSRTLYDPQVHTIGWLPSGKVPQEQLILSRMEFHQSKNKKLYAEKTIKNLEADNTIYAQLIKSCMQDYLDRKAKPKVPPE